MTGDVSRSEHAVLTAPALEARRLNLRCDFEATPAGVGRGVNFVH